MFVTITKEQTYKNDRLLVLSSLVIAVLKNGPIWVTVNALVDKVKDLGLWTAVQFSLDLLRVGILCQLLPGVINKKKQPVFFWICHFKLLSTKLTYIFSSDIWPY